MALESQRTPRLRFMRPESRVYRARQVIGRRCVLHHQAKNGMAFREGRDITCSFSTNSFPGYRQAHMTASAVPDARKIPTLEPPL